MTPRLFMNSILLMVFVVLAMATPHVQAQETQPAETGEPASVEEKPAPYDEKLMRLSEILGSVHYIRNLCKGDEIGWRRSMQDLLDIEAAREPGRKARFTAAFNRGYRAFAAVHAACTPQAIAAEEAYRAEGATLATEIIARYGN